METDIVATLNRMFAVIVEEIRCNPIFAEKLERAITETDPEGAKEPDKGHRQRKRRDPPALNPIDMIVEDETALIEKLSSLSEKQLKDIIAGYGMDPSLRAFQWRKRERLIQYIVDRSRMMASKGNAFRELNNSDNPC